MSTKPDSSQIKHETGTLKDIADASKPLADYTALRAYTGTATTVRITSTGIAGFFTRDADVVTADNGGTVIVDASGRRWKRVFDGAVNVKWFGAVGDGVADDTAPIQTASTYCSSTYQTSVLLLPPTTAHYKITGLINIGIGVSICGIGATVKRYHAKEVANQAFQLGGFNTVDGLTYDGNATGINDQANFTLYHDFNCGQDTGPIDYLYAFRDCTFIDSPGSFILSNRARDVSIEGCNFGEYADHCVYFSPSGDGNPLAINLNVHGNTFSASSATRDAIKSRNGINGLAVTGNTLNLPQATFLTVDYGDVSLVNRRSTRISVSGNNGVCRTFVGSLGSFDGALGDSCIGDISIYANTVDCVYAFLNGVANWLQTSAIGSIDHLSIKANTFKGGNIVVVGAKDRPVRSGSGASATAIVSGGTVTGFTLNAGGSGYLHGAAISIRDPANVGFGATARCTVAGGVVTALTLLTGGTGYVSAPTVYFEEYGILSAIVKDNTFLPQEESGTGGPGAVSILGDVAYSDVDKNNWDCLTVKHYSLASPVSPMLNLASGVSRAELSNNVLRAGPGKPRIINLANNTANSANTLCFESGAGFATDGSVLNDYDTIVIDNNTIDLKFAAPGQNTGIFNAGNSNRAKVYFSRNKQASHSAGRYVPDYTNQRTNWTNGTVRFSLPGQGESYITYDPPSLSAGFQAIATIVLTGAAIGDPVSVWFSNTLDGVTLTGYVSSANTVTCVFFNGTGAVRVLASGRLSAKLVF